MVGAAVRTVVDRFATRTCRGHRAPAAAAQHNALQEGASLAHRPRTQAGTVSGQPLGSGQEGLPRDVRGMVIVDQHLPLLLRLLGGLDPNRPVLIPRPSGSKAAQYVRS